MFLFSLLEKKTIKYAQGSFGAATVRSAVCFWDCHSKLAHSRGLCTIITVEMFYHSLAKCLCDSCVTSLPESLPFFPFGPIL